MTTDNIEQTPEQDDADLVKAFQQGIDDITVTEPPDTKDEAAPSTEGVVTSGADEAQKESPKAEAPKRNLGRLSTDELLAMVAAGDPDAPRAIELRLRRHENQPKRTNKALADLEQRGAAAKQGIDKLTQDYPDIAAGLAPMKDFVDATTAPLREAERQLANDESMARIEQSFPGFVPVARGSEFMGWLKDQPDDVKHDFQHGGNDGAINVLDAFDTHVRSQGKPSPFAPPEPAAPAPAAPDKAAKAAQIVERRAQALKSSAAVPSGSRAITTDNPDTEGSSAWQQGLADVQRMQRTQRK